MNLATRSRSAQQRHHRGELVGVPEWESGITASGGHRALHLSMNRKVEGELWENADPPHADRDSRCVSDYQRFPHRALRVTGCENRVRSDRKMVDRKMEDQQCLPAHLTGGRRGRRASHCLVVSSGNVERVVFRRKLSGGGLRISGRNAEGTFTVVSAGWSFVPVSERREAMRSPTHCCQAAKDSGAENRRDSAMHLSVTHFFVA